MPLAAPSPPSPAPYLNACQLGLIIPIGVILFFAPAGDVPEAGLKGVRSKTLVTLRIREEMLLKNNFRLLSREPEVQGRRIKKDKACSAK